MKFILYKIHLKNPIGEEQQRLNYVGMTTNLISRKSVHKYSCNNENSKSYNLNVYKNIRENGGWDAFCIEPLEDYECENRLEGSKRERYWHDILGGELNTQIPNQTHAESNAIYYANNREERIKIQKIYNDNHKDEKKIYRANYNDNHKDEIKLYRANYYIKNKK
jgi:hypothetical protein